MKKILRNAGNDAFFSNGLIKIIKATNILSPFTSELIKVAGLLVLLRIPELN